MMNLDIPKVLAGFDRAADFLDEIAEKVEEARQEAEGRTPDSLYGFYVGDAVVLTSTFVPEGERGVVDPSAYETDHEGVIPVRKEDGKGDGFPARYTILAAALDSYQPAPPEPWYGQPSGTYEDWNRRILKAIVESNKEDGPGTEVSFSYLKDDDLFPTTRTLMPLGFRLSEGWNAKEYVEGRDADADGEWRNFRLDRIQGYVRPVV